MIRTRNGINNFNKKSSNKIQKQGILTDKLSIEIRFYAIKNRNKANILQNLNLNTQKVIFFSFIGTKNKTDQTVLFIK